jgi:sortase (surface protein transpeptidase)
VTDFGTQAGAPVGLRPPAPIGRHAIGSGRRWSAARVCQGTWRLARRRAARHPLAAVAAIAGVLACVMASAGLVVASHEGRAATPLGRTPFVPVPRENAAPPQNSSNARTVAAPVALVIPVIGVRARLIRLGRTASGTLQVPTTTAVAGWYTGSPRPGAIGAAVIAGHVDSVTGPGVFFRLRLLRPSDLIFVRRADSSLAAFRVVAVQTYAKKHFPTAAVYGPAPVAELRVVTCGGTFDYATRHYLSNVIVFAVAVRWQHSAARPRHTTGIVAPVRRLRAA